MHEIVSANSFPNILILPKGHLEKDGGRGRHGASASFVAASFVASFVARRHVTKLASLLEVRGLPSASSE
jgi:hypothetical protein